MELVSFLIWLSFAWACLHFLINGVRQRKQLPPGPFPLPFVGNLFILGKKPHESLAKLAKSYGPILSLKFGSSIMVVVTSPAMAKEILHKNDQIFSSRSVPEAVKVSDIHKMSMVTSPTNSHWRNLRKISNTQMFTTRTLNANQGLRRQKVQELLAHIRHCYQTGEAVNIAQASFTTTLNLISNTLFSVDLAHPTSKSSQEFKNLVFGFTEVSSRANMVDYFPILKPFDPQGIRRQVKFYIDKLFELFDSMIEPRLQSRKSNNSSSPSSNDLLDVLLDQSEQNPSEFSLTHVKSFLMDLFVAGTDTSSSTIEWAMAELLHNPEAMKKARWEIKETVEKDKVVEETDIDRLPYLQAVVKETLRLHPPVPFLIPRKPEKDVEINGFTVPKNAKVIVNVWAIGRDPTIWVNPNSFMPERFLQSEIDFKGHNFEYTPFGAGRRICPGISLASRVIPLVLGILLHSFDWKLEKGLTPEDMNMEEKFGTALHKAEPLIVIPVQV